MTAPLPQTVPARRSRSVSAIAGLGMLGGVAATFAAVAGIFLRPLLQSALAVTVGPVALLVAWGLWRRREWARQSTIVVMGLSIGYTLLLLAFPSILDRQAGGVVHLSRFVIGQFVFYSVINGLILAKLLTKRVREEFEESD